MQKEGKAKINLNPTFDDYEYLETLAAAQRRNPTGVLRIMFEDLMEGRVNIDDLLTATVERKTAGVAVETEFKQRFDAYREERGGVSADKIMHALILHARRTAGTPNNR